MESARQRAELVERASPVGGRARPPHAFIWRTRTGLSIGLYRASAGAAGYVTACTTQAGVSGGGRRPAGAPPRHHLRPGIADGLRRRLQTGAGVARTARPGTRRTGAPVRPRVSPAPMTPATDSAWSSRRTSDGTRCCACWRPCGARPIPRRPTTSSRPSTDPPMEPRTPRALALRPMSSRCWRDRTGVAPVRATRESARQGRGHGVLDDDMEASPGLLAAHAQAHDGPRQRAVVGAAPIIADGLSRPFVRSMAERFPLSPRTAGAARLSARLPRCVYRQLFRPEGRVAGGRWVRRGVPRLRPRGLRARPASAGCRRGLAYSADATPTSITTRPSPRLRATVSLAAGRPWCSPRSTRGSWIASSCPSFTAGPGGGAPSGVRSCA